MASPIPIVIFSNSCSADFSRSRVDIQAFIETLENSPERSPIEWIIFRLFCWLLTGMFF